MSKAASIPLHDDSELEEDLLPWVSRFLNQPGNEFFCAVETEFILDRFNLTDLGRAVPNAQAGYDYLTMPTSDSDSSEDDNGDEHGSATTLTATAAHHLFGLLHQRYIITPPGLSAMKRKYLRAEFGRCPRVMCEGHPVLPLGLSDIARRETIKVFCPRCKDIYRPKLSMHASVDGAFFGTTFAHLFMMHYKMDMRPVPASVHQNPYSHSVRQAQVVKDPLGDLGLLDGADMAIE